MILIAWMTYAFLEGFRESLYWHLKVRGKSMFKANEHHVWSLQRAVVLFGITAVSGNYYHMIPMALSFPFMHDGAYYWGRNLIDSSIYKKRWLDQSTTSTAFWTKYNPPLVRCISMAAAIVVWFII